MQRITSRPLFGACAAAALLVLAGCEGGNSSDSQNLNLGVSIQVDGDISDWANVKALARDPAGDSPSAIQGTDITDVYVAADAQNFYIRIDLVGNPGTANLRYAVNFESSGERRSVELRSRGLVCNIGERRVGSMAVGNVAGGGATIEASFPRNDVRLGGDVLVECHSAPPIGSDLFDRATLGETVRF